MKNKKMILYILGGLIVLIGISLFLISGSIFKTLIASLGIIIILTGLLKIISSFKSSFLLPGTYFTEGAFYILFGIILIISKGFAASILPITLAILFLITSIGKMGLIINNKKLTKKIDKKELLTAIILLVSGVIFLAFPIFIIETIFKLFIIFIGVYIIYVTYNENKSVYKVRVK